MKLNYDGTGRNASDNNYFIRTGLAQFLIFAPP